MCREKLPRISILCPKIPVRVLGLLLENPLFWQFPPGFFQKPAGLFLIRSKTHRYFPFICPWSDLNEEIRDSSAKNSFAAPRANKPGFQSSRFSPQLKKRKKQYAKPFPISRGGKFSTTGKTPLSAFSVPLFACPKIHGPACPGMYLFGGICKNPGFFIPVR